MNKVKIADQTDMDKGLPGITFNSKAEAIKAITQVKDNGVLVYLKPSRNQRKTLGKGAPSINPEIYQGEVVVYSLQQGKNFLVYSGMIVEILDVGVSRGTSRGEQLAKLGISSQWLIIVKRLGIPGIYDIVDEFGVASQLRFVMDALNGEVHEVKGLASDITFEEIVEALSGGCIQADLVIKQIIKKAMDHGSEVNTLEELWNSLDDSEKPTLH